MQRIYKITNLINNKIYIGKTTLTLEKRLKRHFYLASIKTNRRLYDSINHHGKENFIIELIEECEYDLANEREKYYIALYDSMNKEIGYNMTEGGDGGRMPPESIAKMVAKKKGMTVSEETRRKMSISHKGKRKGISPTEEQRRKISETLKRIGHKPPITIRKGIEHNRYGKTHTDEVKEKLRKYRKGTTWEQTNGIDSAKRNKERMSLRFSGEKNNKYIHFDLEAYLDEILSIINLKKVCKEKYGIVYNTLLYKFRKKFKCTPAKYKLKNNIS